MVGFSRSGVQYTPREDQMEAEIADLQARVVALEEAAPKPDMPTRTFRVPTFEELGMTFKIHYFDGTPYGRYSQERNLALFHRCWQVEPDNPSSCWEVQSVLVDRETLVCFFPDAESARVFIGMQYCQQVVFGP